MTGCKYCGRPAPYEFVGDKGRVYLCEKCLTARRAKLKKDRYKLKHTDLNLLKGGLK